MELRAGQTAFITGGASGIGLAIGRACARRGLSVVVADVEEQAIASAAAELEALGASVLPLRCDVRTPEALDDAARAALDRFGSVHLVCNNAGVVTTGRVEDQPLDAWQWTIDVDLWGVVHGCRTFLPILKRQGEGHVVNTASMAGLYAGPLMAPYYVAKMGVVALSESIWHEARIDASEVGVSVLCPGFVKTRIHQSGRNRPDALPSDTTGEAGVSFLDMLSTGVEQGIDADGVAAMVLEAVEQRRFWILPHGEDSHTAVLRRAQAIVDGATPPLSRPTD